MPAFQAEWERSLAAGAHRARAAERAMQAAYLALLAALPDSHIVRKHGASAAHSVMAQAAPWPGRIASEGWSGFDAACADWDETLKARGLNPGTTADLAVATAFAVALCDHSVFPPHGPA
jgi:triphosphoribosyl-dephospho-CoA synthase